MKYQIVALADIHDVSMKICGHKNSLNNEYTYIHCLRMWLGILKMLLLKILYIAAPFIEFD